MYVPLHAYPLIIINTFFSSSFFAADAAAVVVVVYVTSCNAQTFSAFFIILHKTIISQIEE